MLRITKRELCPLVSFDQSYERSKIKAVPRDIRSEKSRENRGRFCINGTTRRAYASPKKERN